MIFAASIGLPPPKLTIASAPSATRTPSSISDIGACWLITTMHAGRIGKRETDSRRERVVTTAMDFASSSPRFFTDPAPQWMTRGLAYVKVGILGKLEHSPRPARRRGRGGPSLRP